MSWYVYILQCADGTLYTGISSDVERRVAEHNSSKGAKYTRSRRPVRLLYQESAENKGAALSREIAIKKLSREEKLRLIRSAGD